MQLARLPREPRADGLETAPPEKFANALNIGVYQGDENRLVGTEQIPLAELTPEFVRQRVETAAAEQIGRALDPETVREFFEQFPRPQLRDMEGAG